jgi:hypothetical protein
MLAESPDGPSSATLGAHRRRSLVMPTPDTIDTPAFSSSPDTNECFARTIDAPLRTVEAAVARLDLIGPLVDGLIAIGLGDHIVTPCSNGLV